MTHAFLWRRQRYFLLPFCLGLIVLADYLFYGHPLGWNAALFAGIAAAAVALRAPGLWRSMSGRIALALAGIILLALVEEPSPLAILMSGFCLGTLVLVARGGWTISLTAWFVRWLHLVVTVPIRGLLDSRIAARWFINRPANRPASLRVFLRWIIPIFAGVGFLILFTIANPVLQQWASTLLTKLITIFEWLPLYLRPARLLLWCITGIGTYGLLRYRGRYSRVSRIAIPPIIHTRPTSAHQFIIRCLIVFNVVFAVQSVLDIVYLFGGVALPPGMTYAHYAHRGAYPLVATALLAGLFVLKAFTSGGPAHRSAAARRLVFLWIAQNIFLLISTIWRLWLYIDAYSLTRLRLATIIWIILLGFGFLFLVWKILAGRSNVWLWRANTATLAAVLYLCAFINFPGLIANFNVYHCLEIDGRGAPLDVAYLTQLGSASLPALAWVRPRLNATRQAEAINAEAHLHSSLAETLNDWRGWTLRRARAHRALPPVIEAG